MLNITARNQDFRAVCYFFCGRYKAIAIAGSGNKKKLLQNNPDVIAKIGRNGVQRLDLDPNTPVSAYDYADMLDKYFPQEQLVSVKSALSKSSGV